MHTSRRYFFLFFMLSCQLFAVGQNTDIELLRNINLGRDRQLDPACRFLSKSVAPVSFALPIGLYATAWIKKDSTLRNKSLTMAGGLLLAVTVSTALKYGVNRERPFVTYSDIDPAISVNTPSFPSGHTSDAFGTATALSLAFPKWYVITPAYAYACAIGYSRMALGVHYPSDVLAGALIGSGCSWLSYKANKWINRKRR